MCIHLIMVEYINPASLPSPLPPSLHPPPGPLYPFIPLAVVPPPPPPGPRLHRTQHPRSSNSHTATDAEAGRKERGHAAFTLHHAPPRQQVGLCHGRRRGELPGLHLPASQFFIGKHIYLHIHMYIYTALHTFPVICTLHFS